MSPVLRAGPVSQARFEALRILGRVESDRAFADITLEHALERAALEPRDAALCTEIVYGTLRWQRHLDWRLAAHLHRPLARLDPWVRALLRLTAYQLLFLDRVVNLVEEGVDVGVRIGALRDSSLTAVRVGQMRRVVCASGDYLRRHGAPRTPNDVRGHRCIRHSGLVTRNEWQFRAGRNRTVSIPINSIVTSFCSTAFALIVGLPAAYALSRARFRFSRRIALWILATRMAPPIAFTIW